MCRLFTLHTHSFTYLLIPLIHPLPSCITLINDELSKIIEWLNINKLSLNKDKSKYMIFHMHKKEIPSLSLKLGNANIEKLDDFNYLPWTQI